MSLQENWLKEAFKLFDVSDSKLKKLVRLVDKYEDLEVNPENLLGAIGYLEHSL